MIVRMWRLELGLLARDSRVRWIAGVLALMMVASFALGLGEVRRNAIEAERLTQVERQRWLSQDPKNPHSAAHYGLWAFKPVSPLATIDPGLNPYLGRMVRVEAHRRNDAVFRAAQDEPTLARGGIGSVVSIVQIVVPLVVILLGFAAFAGDRERGTLRLALGNGAAPMQLLAARFGALFALTAAIVGVPALLLGGIANLAVPAAAEWQPWPRLILWTVAQLGYAAIFLLIATAASLVAKTTRAALAASLLAWLLLVVAAPRLTASAVEAVAPTPAYADVQARIEAEIKRYNRADLHQQRERAILARYGAADAKRLPIDLRGAMMHDREQHDYAVYDHELGRFDAELARQERLVLLAGLLSPTVAIQTLSEQLAGSDLRRHADFLRTVEAYRRQLSDTMNLDLVAHPAGTGGPYLATRDVWARLPPFADRPAPLAAVLAGAVLPAGLLVLWLVVMAGIAIRAARQVRP
jgi:ABC-2 type transport system permease protein